ncbi:MULTISPECIES: hypothetical protein [Streptomyces]|uniref:Uncharacterized protein n=2 Tax=Streptomyces TaxID=1883 RepID=A0ABV9J3Z5_9ACTN
MLATPAGWLRRPDPPLPRDRLDEKQAPAVLVSEVACGSGRRPRRLVVVHRHPHPVMP